MPKLEANVRQGGNASSVWGWLGLDSPADRTRAHRLVAAAARAGRAPALYGPGRAPDTFSGRFEIAALHAILLTRRVGAERRQKRLAQAVSNRIFATFDEALREVGEGDLSVAKRMKSLARAFYGRLKVYQTALEKDGDDAAADLAAALSRNIWDADAAPFAPALAAYSIALDRALAASPLAALEEATAWPTAAL